QTKWRLGKPNRVSGQCSLDYLNSAVEFLKKKKISALVTAPVCKEAIAKFQPHFQGHTEYLADHFNKKNVGMLFVAQNLKTLIVTRHIPLKRVSQSITSSLLVKSIQMTDQALKDYFKIKRPRLAICGLNPHAGENGLLGREEQRIIIPVIKKLHSNRLHIEGPFPADTLFCPDKAKHYDAIIAMYHDQGLIPIKTLYFHKVVNLTIGLPVIRTSPSHGTAFDIAGKNCANPASMIEAIKLAAQLAP
ncbi:MAG: 4-hydroxythreonine-4-phosphate dehydrogenase PdxA, partial [Candidatus Omnitrophica bacterium]|nr:4-hydroxythreonine-4-phosphate dehydrogenase PdxA [Candidatus Omnitrophota bacterium]